MNAHRSRERCLPMWEGVRRDGARQEFPQQRSAPDALITALPAGPPRLCAVARWRPGQPAGAGVVAATTTTTALLKSGGLLLLEQGAVVVSGWRVGRVEHPTSHCCCSQHILDEGPQTHRASLLLLVGPPLPPTTCTQVGWSPAASTCARCVLGVPHSSSPAPGRSGAHSAPRGSRWRKCDWLTGRRLAEARWHTMTRHRSKQTGRAASMCVRPRAQ